MTNKFVQLSDCSTKETADQATYFLDLSSGVLALLDPVASFQKRIRYEEKDIRIAKLAVEFNDFNTKLERTRAEIDGDQNKEEVLEENMIRDANSFHDIVNEPDRPICWMKVNGMWPNYPGTLPDLVTSSDQEIDKIYQSYGFSSLPGSRDMRIMMILYHLGFVF
ncbi:hypothetical protein CANTEDRAFT_94177 [Yamadazyma tenuis ATCC 10573]|uniref:Uncharacterized protein n=2 Tax=Candida tenuis TaxID=2315449 RepID=G3B6A3_CANTC|nr:uncharacterized protein CANTEDRAFT_94177 [Yamadazyma tenuis ATCC 10573]EGV63420.1 hypothetical protein CANTEDRAFT_94177 [Yamadazyma tenuis ATCC 10573]